MLEVKGPKLSNIPGAKAYLVLVMFEDNCQLQMNPLDGSPEGWLLSFPGGFEATCPHGFVAGVVPALEV